MTQTTSTGTANQRSQTASEAVTWPNGASASSAEAIIPPNAPKQPVAHPQPDTALRAKEGFATPSLPAHRDGATLG